MLAAWRRLNPRWRLIPAGEAILGGDDPEAYDDEKPECSVWVDAFELAVYPVTNAEFACFVDAGGYRGRGPVDGGRQGVAAWREQAGCGE